MNKEFDFMNAIKNELNKAKTLTENGALAYASSGKELLDFNFHISNLRDMDEDEVAKAFFKALYEEGPVVAIKYLFYVGDVREGLGERRTFRLVFNKLAVYYPELIAPLVKLIPEYHRWDYLVDLCVYCHSSEVSTEAFVLIQTQLKKDIEDALHDEPISLLAKWLPSENTSSKKTRFKAKVMAQALGYSPRIYRKILSKLRKHLDVVEQKMSAKQWEEIDYNAVPSQANLKYKNAFLRNDEERRREYLRKLQRGESDVKINAGTLYPHQIVGKYMDVADYYYASECAELDPALEELWKALPNLSLENTLVVRDGSGSMFDNGRIPIYVATALAIYMAEHNTGVWKDKYITFSSNPRIVDQSMVKTLKDKVTMALKYHEISNTDIYKTMMLILDTAVNNNLTQDQMPKNIVICSDMQFDSRFSGYNETLFESIQREFKEHGYLLPRIIFWNLAADRNRSNTVPIQQNDLGMVLMSGFSLQLLKMVMSNSIDPYQALLDEINTDRYKPVEEVVRANKDKFFY